MGSLPVATVTTNRPAPGPTYEIARGDWLWHIAGRFLGDPARYGEIAVLNPDLEHRDGRFPDHIEATWSLVLPADAHDHGARAHATGTLVALAPSPTTAPGAGDPPTPVESPHGAGTSGSADRPAWQLSVSSSSP